MNYATPIIVFKPSIDDPLVLNYGVAFYEGCFTATGMFTEVIQSQLKEIENWCVTNKCGRLFKPSSHNLKCKIYFDNEQELSFFLLRWK